jgi:hypothetical protein
VFGQRWLHAHWAAEVVCYALTALPQLLQGLTPELASANADK